MPIKKIVVIGGYGFVGQNVITHLQAQGNEPVPLSRRNGFDLTDYETASEKLKGIKPDFIINCAAHVGSLHYVAEYSATVADENMRMITNLYRIAKEACPEACILNPISNCAYPGDAVTQVEAEFWNGPVHSSVWSFANAKRMLLVLSDCYHKQHETKSANFIVPNAYGPGDYTDPNKTHALNGLVIRMLKAKHENQSEFEIWGTGKPIREWIFVKDIARLFAIALNKQTEGTAPVNIGQKRGHSIGELASLIKHHINYPGKLVFNTRFPDGAPVKVLDDTLFREHYPDFEFTPLEIGIKETVEYYQQKLEFKPN